MKIFLDLDGVCCDFNKRYVELFGEFPEGVYRREKHFWKNWKAFIAGNNFATLDKMPDADVLLSYLESTKLPIEILSSSGGHEYHDIVVAQKSEWLNKHNIQYPRNIVPGSKYKSEYATPDSILIDDHIRNVERFRAAGGIAIHHTSAKNTIEILHDIMDISSDYKVMREYLQT